VGAGHGPKYVIETGLEEAVIETAEDKRIGSGY
jgi:hypothetical protein